MGITHIRTPKNFVLEERLERYADAIETRPEAYRGRWAEACRPLEPDNSEGSDTTRTGAFSRVHLDLGCGKGTYIAVAAERDPDTLYLGMDIEPICIAYAAQRIVEAGLRNAVVIPRGAGALARMFAPGELAAITLNFPTPYPKRHHAARRLTHVGNLVAYRELLRPGGTLTLRTDSQPLRDYSLTQLESAGWRVLWISDDVRAEHPGHPETEYEQRLVERGALVWGICAEPGDEPGPDDVQRGRDAEQSLVAYLPQDLENLDYVPLGMEAAVQNFLNRERKGKRRIP